MKPDRPVARRGDYVIAKIEHAKARQLVERYHYARGASNTSVAAHGLIRRVDGECVGAALWMPPTARAAKGLARMHLGDLLRHREVLVLSRLVVAPGEPQNAAGMLLGASERLIRTDTRWSLLVTYADTAEGHTGTIYRATNWHVDGETMPRARWIEPTSGRIVAMLSTKNRTVPQMIAAGFVRGAASRKIRFVKVIR